jgi:putative two-component system response regulator
VDLLQKGKGQHFDPILVDLFLDSMDEVLEIRERFQDA